MAAQAALRCALSSSSTRHVLDQKRINCRVCRNKQTKITGKLRPAKTFTTTWARLESILGIPALRYSVRRLAPPNRAHFWSLPPRHGVAPMPPGRSTKEAVPWREIAPPGRSAPMISCGNRSRCKKAHSKHPLGIQVPSQKAIACWFRFGMVQGLPFSGMNVWRIKGFTKYGGQTCSIPGPYLLAASSCQDMVCCTAFLQVYSLWVPSGLSGCPHGNH